MTNINELNKQIDELLPIQHILRTAKTVLGPSGGTLTLSHPQRGIHPVLVPKDADLYIKFRAYIKEDLAESSVVEGDHYQAHILIGHRNSDTEYGTLVLHFDLEGTFIPQKLSICNQSV